MKTYRNIYETLIAPENLFGAWDEFKRGKRHKEDVLRFEADLEPNIFKLHRELKDKSYRHGGYTDFFIYDPKLRHIHKAAVRDRILHHAVFRTLNPIFEPTFINDSFSCRVGKGTHKGVEAVSDMLRKASRNNTLPCYALKCDVRKFFDSIDQDILFGIFRKRVKDADMRWLVRNILDSYASGQSDLFHSRGLPIGNLTSQLFANVYMNELDQFMKSALRVRYYARYTDDFVILSNDKAEVAKMIPKIEEFLKERLALELHPNKIEIRSYGQGVDFLGYLIFPHHRILRKKTEQRMWRKIRHTMRRYEREDIDRVRAAATVQSYLGILSHADAHRLQERVRNEFGYVLKA